MIPLRIEVTNFGAIPHADIDLSNVALAAVAGPNGAGKSTLFTIAPMFALFGATKNGCSVDDMVRTGTQEMAVSFEFEHRGETYRVTRTRSKKGKGKSTLELQHLVGGQWVSESGTTIRETDEKIKALLNLDEETFAASSMILQGRANEFTVNPPGQRKAVLAQILGLEVYDDLQEKAREKERAAHVALEKAKAKAAELDEKLQTRAGLQDELAEIETQLADLAREIEGKEAELLQAEEQARGAAAKAERARDLESQIKALMDEITARQQERQKLQEQAERARKMLDAEAQIIAKAAELEQVKQQITELKTRQPILAEAQTEENRIASELRRIETTIGKLASQIEATQAALASKEALEKAAADYQKAMTDLEALDALAEKWRALDAQAKEAQATWGRADAEFKARVKALEKELADLRARAAMLDDSGCIDPERAACRFLADAQAAKARIPQVQAEYEAFDPAEIIRLEKGWHDLEAQRDALGYDPKERQRLKDMAATLRPKAEQAAQLASKAELLQNLQEQQRSAEEQRTELANRLQEVRQKIGQLAGELKTLPALEERVKKLEGWAKAKEELPAARQIATTAAERLEAIAREVETKEGRAKELEQERQSLLKNAAQAPAYKARVEELRLEMRRLQEQQNSTYARVGSLKALLEALDKAQEERQKLAAEMEPMAKDLTRWQTLVKAFGRDGIPALIIENAVPELERIANEILGQMSKGGHSLKFETQRDLKSRAGVAETLDIIVSDWNGERPYETFSGGEQLRIDFAIRFALAELLARRAGSRVEWLTVDEGLGSQDAEHRGLVLEAIRAVADRFKKTLVITHIEEAKAFFGQVIYVEPNGAGTDVMVA
ncbi:MAG: SMC family ATPase [Syntrophothermus sp.]|uniref:AAA family ATPase n=1 Tax=Syntrophothermus sp. TaxID=2736299 RepID=UPI002580481F|nr:SMC family ATPase [Syntrophothermus sp.]NSW84080.1 SMC family ATPase [Syntrophothermus sp.]